MRIVVLETSGSFGEVAIADEREVKEVRQLSAARKHARDLVPELKDLLQAAHWKPATIDLVLVDIGPGSYTGLRVGLMTATTFAYATGAAVVAMEAPVVLAEEAPPELKEIAILIDAQQGRIYASRFERATSDAHPQLTAPTVITQASEWARNLPEGCYVTGPALSRFSSVLPAHCLMAKPMEQQPSALGLWRSGLRAFESGRRDDLWTLEPLYLRPSAAEEKWDQRKAQSSEQAPSSGATSA